MTAPAPPAAHLDSAARLEPAALSASIRGWARELGLTGIGVATLDLPADEAFFLDWLRAGFNGEMGYMSRHGLKRSRPAELIPGTVSCISVRMDYWPEESADASGVLGNGNLAYVSRYALGRDYHKVLRSRLQKLCDRIHDAVGPFGHRVFTDSAPVLEKALARNAGLGWIGKHTNLIDRNAGSYFFLGEIYLDLQLPADEPSTAHCGSCSACMPACPTGAAFPTSRLSWPAAFRWNFARPSAIAFTVAMIVSWSVLGTNSRVPRWRTTSPFGMDWTRRSWSSFSLGASKIF
jgi:epoxyqueuosine reductase